MSSRKNFATLLLFAAGLLSTACSSARLVRQTQYGGMIALEDERKDAFGQAQEIMNHHCNGFYTIVEESEKVAASSALTHNTRAATFADPLNASNPRLNDLSQGPVEIQVRYQCNHTL